MKKRKKKRRKLALFFIIIIIIVIIIIFKPSPLKGMGYTNYRELETKMNNRDISVVAKFEYNPELTAIVFSDEYNKEKLEDYLTYSKNNHLLKGEEVVKLVNHNINKSNIPYDPIMLELVNQDYYLDTNLERYINYSKKNDYSEERIVSDVNSNIDYPFYTSSKNADLSKGNLILVDKYYRLPNNYEPSDLIPLSSSYGSWGSIREEVYDAFIKLNKDASKLGYRFYTTSPFRDYATQTAIYNRYVNNYGLEMALRSSAKPGYSEHQTGLAMDLSNGKSSMYDFENTPDSKWLQKNAHKYGFILRYPKDKEYLTGYKYEPWHYRYVGIEAATYIYEHNIIFEEYYAYFVNN